MGENKLMKTEFSDNQFKHAYADDMEFHWWSYARSKIITTLIKSFVKPKSSILEIGCGRGIVVKGLRDAGIDCYGVEIANVSPIQTIEKYVHVGIDAVELPYIERQRYETILLLDVIEHIPEPAAFLKNLAKNFPNLLSVIITVPSRQELWSNYDEFYGHFIRYTPEMLEKISNELGWSLKRKGYFFHMLYVPALLMVKLKQKRKVLLTPPQGVSRLLHKLISYAMIADYYFLPANFFGTSVMGCYVL